ncbi:MAG: hypothetical protein RMJ46_07675 [Bacteroidota bacterium]|nr:hypothetical protein [Bacteroidota bacterium]
MPSKEDINRQIEDLLHTVGIRPVSSEEANREEYQLLMKASRILSSDQADSKAQEALNMLETALSTLKPNDERLRVQCLTAAAIAASYLKAGQDCRVREACSTDS